MACSTRGKYYGAFFVVSCPSSFSSLPFYRQNEVSDKFAQITCVEILHTKAIWERILTGPRSKYFYAMLRAHSIVFTEKIVGGLKPLVITVMGGKQFAQMKEDIATEIAEKLPGIMPYSYQYTTEALDVENTLAGRMKLCTYEEFEG